MTERAEKLRREIAAAKCIVVKIGSALLTDLENGLSYEQLAAWSTCLRRWNSPASSSMSLHIPWR